MVYTMYIPKSKRIYQVDTLYTTFNVYIVCLHGSFLPDKMSYVRYIPGINKAYFCHEVNVIMFRISGTASDPPWVPLTPTWHRTMARIQSQPTSRKKTSTSICTLVDLHKRVTVSESNNTSLQKRLLNWSQAVWPLAPWRLMAIESFANPVYTSHISVVYTFWVKSAFHGVVRCRMSSILAVISTCRIWVVAVVSSISVM